VMARKATDKLQEEQLLILKMKFESLEAFDQDILAENDLEAVLKKAIDSLPGKCREIFIKSRIEGKKQREIATEMDISIHTIETQMGIAYKKLRAELKNYLPLLMFL
jgi:RNA polymerase sigma-70 factor (ECF subfamily)